MASMERETPLSVRISGEFLQWYKDEAKRRGISLSAHIREAMLERMQRQAKEPGVTPVPAVFTNIWEQDVLFGDDA